MKKNGVDLQSKSVSFVASEHLAIVNFLNIGSKLISLTSEMGTKTPEPLFTVAL